MPYNIPYFGVLIFIFFIIGIFLVAMTIVHSFRSFSSLKENGVNDISSVKEIEEVNTIHIKKFDTMKTLSNSDIIWVDSTDVPDLSELAEVPRLHHYPQVRQRSVVWIFDGMFNNDEKPFWAWFQSPRSIENGLIRHFDEIEQTGFVLCKVVQELERLTKGAWYEVEVVKALPLTDISKTVPIDTYDDSVKHELLEHIHCEIIFSDDQWELLSNDPRGYSGQWLVIEKLESEKRIVAYGNWIKEQHEVFLMNLPLRGGAAEFLSLQASERHAV